MNEHPIKRPTDERQTEWDAQIDRLVTGDLSENERALVLQHARACPEFWQRIAIAFLESQAWSESLSDLALHSTPNSPTALSLSVLTGDHPLTNVNGETFFPSFRWLSLGTIAASALLAFIAGWVSRPTSNPNSESQVLSTSNSEADSNASTQWVWATVERAPFDVPMRGARMQIAVRMVDGKPVESSASSIQISEYQEQLLNRRGLSITKDFHFVTAILPDGTDVAIPYENLSTRPSKRIID